MPLRALPPSERTFATLVLLGLALALGVGLSSVFTRELRPSAPTQTPPARSRLVAVLEGVMAANVTPRETERFKAWVASGASREGFSQVESVVANNCASCHDRGDQFPRIAGFEDLQPIALEAAPTGLSDLVSPKALHTFGFPLIMLVAAGIYLRRAAWRGRKALMGACALAVVFDMVQWSMRQGRPEMLWAAWTACAALAAAMAALVVVVLWELWMVPRED